LSRLTPKLSSVAPDLQGIAPELRRVASDLSCGATQVRCLATDLRRVAARLSRVAQRNDLLPAPACGGGALGCAGAGVGVGATTGGALARVPVNVPLPRLSACTVPLIWLPLIVPVKVASVVAGPVVTETVSLMSLPVT